MLRSLLVVVCLRGIAFAETPPAPHIAPSPTDNAPPTMPASSGTPKGWAPLPGSAPTQPRVAITPAVPPTPASAPPAAASSSAMATAPAPAPAPVATSTRGATAAVGITARPFEPHHGLALDVRLAAGFTSGTYTSLGLAQVTVGVGAWIAPHIAVVARGEIGVLQTVGGEVRGELGPRGVIGGGLGYVHLDDKSGGRLHAHAAYRFTPNLGVDASVGVDLLNHTAADLTLGVIYLR